LQDEADKAEPKVDAPCGVLQSQQRHIKAATENKSASYSPP